jgi:hypothetical protein
MDKILLTWTCLFAGFFAGNAATMFLTHWLRAVMAAFGRGPVSAPHRVDALAVLMLTLLHPVPWMLLIGGWLGINRLIFGATILEGIPEGWRWFWIGASAWAIFVAAISALIMRRVRKARAKIGAQ